MRALRLIGRFFAASLQELLAYRANFWISVLHSVLNLGTGMLGVGVLFGQVETVRGWTYPSALALLGVYLTLNALRSLFIGLSLESLVGMDGEVWTGQFDYTLLHPVDVQFEASFRRWRPLAALDLFLGLGVLVVAVAQLGASVSLTHVGVFCLTLTMGLLLLAMTWVVPVGVMTTVPVQALTGELQTGALIGAAAATVGFLAGV